MCGIVGFIGEGDKACLKQMTDAIIHRGPDDEGFFADEKNRVFLGMRRLSIIDVAGGRQPMFSEDKNITAVFNGEIYNFAELKNLLEIKHTFLTKSDTEVLVHGYEEWGKDLFKKLRGMFAIAIWDNAKKELVLSRDPFGEKPLHWGIFGGTLVFGSELKSLLKHASVKKEISFESLNQYLNFEYVPTPGTIFKNIYKLRPAHFAVYKNGLMREEMYWSILEEGEHPPYRNEDDVLRVLESKINESVRMQMVSDVPLGVFLSGGIDSSTVTYFAQKNSAKKVKTFSIGFDDKSFNESHMARKVAARLGTDHYEFQFASQTMIDLIPEVFGGLDEPMADPALLPTFLLSRSARSAGITVALGGEGSDELFMGYPTFQAARMAGIYKRLIPEVVRVSLVEPLVRRMPSTFGYFSLDFRAKKFISGQQETPEVQNQIWLGAIGPEERINLFAPHLVSQTALVDLFGELKSHAAYAKDYTALDRMSYVFTKTYLEGDILAKVDRASMANSLEIRAPFLDRELASLIFHLPESLKCPGIKTKYILKKLMVSKIGKDIAYRKKQGFAVPVARWLLGPLQPMMRDLLSPERLKRDGYFNPIYISRLIDEHVAGKNDNRKKLWTLMAFQLWYDNFMR